MSPSFPVGVIAVCVVSAALVLLLVGGVYNYIKNGKKWLQAVPGYDNVRSTIKTENNNNPYTQAPEIETNGRYESNF